MPANHEDSSSTEALGVPALRAFKMIGVGKDKGFRMLKQGELESVKIGRSRIVLMRSIKRVLQLEAA